MRNDQDAWIRDLEASSARPFPGALDLEPWQMRLVALFMGAAPAKAFAFQRGRGSRRPILSGFVPSAIVRDELLASRREAERTYRAALGLVSAQRAQERFVAEVCRIDEAIALDAADLEALTRKALAAGWQTLPQIARRD